MRQAPVHPLARLVTLVALILMSAGLSACRPDHRDPRPPAEPRLDPIGDEAYPGVVLFDGLEADVVRGELRTPRTGRGTIERVVVPLRSRSDLILHLQYRVIYRDSDGAEVTNQPVWHPFSLLPRARRSIEDIPVESGAMTAFVEIRKERR